MREIVERRVQEMFDTRTRSDGVDSLKADLDQVQDQVAAHAHTMQNAEETFVNALEGLSHELRALLAEKVDHTVFVETSKSRDDRVMKLTRQIKEFLESSEQGMNTHQASVIKLASALEQRDGQVEALNEKLLKIEADMAEEMEHTRACFSILQDACDKRDYPDESPTAICGTASFEGCEAEVYHSLPVEEDDQPEEISAITLDDDEASVDD